MADAEGNIDEGDRCEIAFGPIDDVEYVLQHGTADSFLDACREVSSGEKKGFMLSVAHAVTGDRQRGYPFKDRIADVLPWMRNAFEHDRSEEHTSELQSLMRSSYAVFCLKKKKHYNTINTDSYIQKSLTKNKK